MWGGGGRWCVGGRREMVCGGEEGEGVSIGRRGCVGGGGRGYVNGRREWVYG